MGRQGALLLASLMVVSACSGGNTGDDSSTTTAPLTTEATTTQATTTTLAPSTTTTTTTTAPTTSTTATTTSTTTSTTSSTSSSSTTTTTAAPASTLMDRLVRAREVAEVNGWFFEISDSTDGGGPDSGSGLAEACLTDFDERFDDAPGLVEAVEAELEGFGGGLFDPIGNIAMWQYESIIDAAPAVDLISGLLGTDEGAQCVADSLRDELSEGFVGDDLEVVVAESTVGGADAGLLVLVTFTIQETEITIYVDMLAAFDDDVVALLLFLSFDEQLDRDLVSAFATSLAGLGGSLFSRVHLTGSGMAI